MVERFKEWYVNRHTYAKQWKERTGGKVIGDLKITQVATFKIQVVSGFPHRSRSFMRQFFSPLLQRL